jgi:hypothetical protein
MKKDSFFSHLIRAGQRSAVLKHPSGQWTVKKAYITIVDRIAIFGIPQFLVTDHTPLQASSAKVPWIVFPSTVPAQVPY